MADKKKFDPLARTRLDSGARSGAGGTTRIRDILTSLGEKPAKPDDAACEDFQDRTLLLGGGQSPETLVGWIVEVDSCAGPYKSHELKCRHYVLGRGKSVDIRIDDKTVSREHCELVWMDGYFEIKDFDSGNGVIVDGYPKVRSRLENGAVIRLGEVELWVRLI